MALPDSYHDREMQKFTEDADGEVCVRTSVEKVDVSSAPYYDTVTSGSGNVASPGTPVQITSLAKAGFLIVTFSYNDTPGNWMYVGQQSGPYPDYWLTDQGMSAVFVLTDISQVYIDADSASDYYSWYACYKN